LKKPPPSRHFISDPLQQQNIVMLIAALIMSCAVLGSSLTIAVGVKMFFEHQKHADAGESKHYATARLADVAVRNVETAESARMHANFGGRACCAYSAKFRLGNPYLYYHGS
jgi:hypothetical protein